MGRGGGGCGTFIVHTNRWRLPRGPSINDLSRSLAAFDPASTLVVVVEMSKASWLVSGRRWERASGTACSSWWSAWPSAPIDMIP
jgi:hypothetical protein